MKLMTCFTLIILLGGGTPFDKKESDFHLIKESKGIKLFSRNFKLPDGEITRELKAEYLVRCSSDKLLKLIENENYSKQWLNGVKRIYTLNKPAKNCWYTYMEYQLPWPFNNQDCILKYTLTTHTNGYIIDFVSMPEYLPAKEGIERITHLQGRWTIITRPDNLCKVSYSAYTADKAKYPRWVADPIVQENLISNLSAMKKMAERL
ncbi:MAG: hypothetical protein K0R51_741 [Cytophagaceae bacterium]|jgi:hypothetical protein|nr:hypothetical protein [Cytophagaceae bacterium]